ncbi:MAG: rhodanese-like domain-containing protein [Rhodocyclaceae bacterium]|nr:rhodanese-like domain-containing protein [Rhodocyclaceae bacterium]
MEKSFNERVAEARQAVSAISAEQAAALRAGSEDVVFIDPRPAAAIAASTGIIQGASNVTLGEIASGNLPPQLANRAARVIASCQADPMGAIAAHELQKRGFCRVSYLDGGTQAWLDAGLPTVGRQ